MTEDTANLGRQMAKGAAWMVAMRWSIRGIGIVSVVILARLLAPDDFGILAMAMIVVGFFGILTETYMDLALIRDAGATRSHYDTAWTLGVLQGMGVAAVVILIASPASSYFNDSRVELVIQVLALGIFIQGFENIGVVAFRKELDFVEKGGTLWYRVARVPNDLRGGDRVFLVWRGKVRGWMEASGTGDWLPYGFTCEVTGRWWPPGYYVIREGKFHTVNGPEMTGFRGIRKYKHVERN